MITAINNTAQVSLPSDTEVRVTRDFKAPRQLVWQAHTDATLVPRWIGGYAGWSMPVCEMDVRPGGKYRWRWRSDEDDKEFGWDAHEPGHHPHNIHRKERHHDAVMLIEYGSKEERDAAISTGMTDGMETSYERLDKLVAEPQGG